MLIGEVFKLNATVTPSNATNGTVSWASTDESVATVSQGGTVEAKGAGKTLITATTQNGIVAYCVVDVIGFNNSTFKDTDYYKTESNWENGVLYIGTYLMEAKNTVSGNYTVKEGTKTIADDAFSQCASLTNIIIPDSVKSIGDSAFKGCDSLTIYGTAGSYAEKYANDNNIPFKALGDIDFDGTITSNDYAMLRSYVMCQTTMAEKQCITADFNGDGAVDAFDVIALDVYLHQ